MIYRDLQYEKIVTRILIYTVSICTILTVTLIYFSHDISKQMMFKLIDNNAFYDTEIYSEAVGEYLKQRMNPLENYAEIPFVKSMDREKIELYLKEKVNKQTNEKLEEDQYRKSKKYEVLFIVDALGNMYRTDGKEEYAGGKRYFKLAMEGKSHISKSYISEYAGKSMCTMTVPIKDKNENIVGLIGGVIDLEILDGLTTRYRVNCQNSYSYIIDKNGFFVTHPHENIMIKENITKKSDEINDSLIKAGLTILKKHNGRVEYDIDGVPTNAYFSRIPNTDDWKFVLKVPKAYLYEPIQGKTNTLLLIAVLGMIIIGMISLIAGQFIARPMLKLKRDMEENKKLLEERNRYDKMKTEFFSNISHELKTPLNIIFSTIQLLELYVENSNLDGEHIKLNNRLDVMKQNCNRLLRLINNLIDITKIDSGFMILNLQNKNIVEVVEDITLSTVEYVESKSKHIIFDTETEEKVMAFDPDKMERIILNLISNAVKFTHSGDQIQVNIQDGEERIIISVKDTGIGIPKEKQKFIFERFRQADPLLNRRAEGSGIGLSLVKSFVKMHGGEITLESECGKGTEIMIELPVKLVYEKNIERKQNDFLQKDKVERINIEFSDIYS